MRNINGVIDPPAEVRPADAELNNLAVAINREYEAGRAAFRKGIEHFLTTGQMLIEAKARCRNFRAWLQEHVTFSRAQAYRYIELAELSRCETLSPDELQDQWRRIQGHLPKEDLCDDGNTEKSVRLKLFELLAPFPTGLAQRQIKEHLGHFPGKIIYAEGRRRKPRIGRQPFGNRMEFLYYLTDRGHLALKIGSVDSDAPPSKPKPKPEDDPPADGLQALVWEAETGNQGAQDELRNRARQAGIDDATIIDAPTWNALAKLIRQAAKPEPEPEPDDPPLLQPKSEDDNNPEPKPDDRPDPEPEDPPGDDEQTDPEPEPDEPADDFDGLVREAEDGNEAAQEKLRNLARKAGFDEDTIVAAPTWNDLVRLIRGEDPQPEPEPERKKNHVKMIEEAFQELEAAAKGTRQMHKIRDAIDKIRLHLADLLFDAGYGAESA